MPSEKPLINVVITTYTSQRFETLKEAVQSVQDQTYGQENIRIIIATNGFDLAHKKAVEDTYKGIKNIICLYTPRSNCPAALNNAIRHLTDDSIDYETYITKTLREVGPGKRKITAKEETLLNIDTSYLFNVQTIQRTGIHLLGS